jgi:Carboxypeptidase regulatory-like domain
VSGLGRNMQVAVFLILAAFAVVLHCSVAWADDVYGKIRGTVVDPTGAAVVSAKVVATNVATGISKETVSGADGSYEFLQLAAPATYNVSARQTGFKAFEAHYIHLSLNQVYVLNITFEVGIVTQVVVVEAATAQVETTNIQLGHTIYGITDLPLNGRNWVQLQQTLPGVVAASDRFTTNFATNGGRSQANSYLVNGTDANDLPLNSIQVVPSPDAIAEVTVITNTINPEYGRNGGAILNATTKSGTNTFHGDAFEFYRDTGLNTRNFFSTKTTVFHRNQFGGVIGGPIKKDKAFFFFSYQGTRDRRPQAGGTSTVFTPAERSGDFSADGPMTGPSPFPLVGESGATFPAGTDYATIFPTSHIPAADFNPVALNLTKAFVPLPTTGSTFQFNPVTTSTTNQYISRIDYNMTSKDSIWGYWFIQPNSSTDTLPFTGADLPGFPEQSTARTQHYTVAWSHSFSTSTVNEARMGYNRLNFIAVEPVTPVLPSSVGFAGINPQSTAGAGVPLISVTGLFTLGFSNNGPQPRIDQTYHFTDNFSKVVGRHSLKFGFEMRRSRVDNPFFFNNNGNYTFAGQGTFTTGIAGADFLLGIPDSYAQSSGGFIAARTQTYYSYAQDQYTIRPSLTLTYGIGWQVDTPLKDLFNKGVAVNCFSPGQQSTVFPTAPAGLTFPGDKGCNSAAGVTTHYKDFGPRVGFAWSPGSSHKWSIRAGYGIYFNRTEEELALQNLLAPPFSLTSGGIGDLGGSPGFATPFTDINTGMSLANKFPFTPASPGSKVDFSFFEPFSLNVFDPHFSNPYSQNYNLTIQRELPGATILTVSYVGSLGHKLTKVVEANPAGSAAGNPICKATPGCNSFNNFATAPQSFRFPQTNASGVLIFGSVGTQQTTANSNYNSVQVTVDKHLTHGLQFRATYTYSHSLDSASSFEDFGNFRGSDPFNPRNDYGNSTFDARQRFVVSYVYSFPSVHRFGAFRRILDGWKIAGATLLQAGFPLTITDLGFRSFTCDPTFVFYQCWDRPNFVGPTVQTFDPRTSSVVNSIRGGTVAKDHYYFNPNNFAREALGTLGNAGRNFFHGPGLNNTDLAVLKDTKISESTAIQLRLEFFNLLNHTQFQPVQTTSGVNANSNSSNFGRILNARPAGVDSRIIQLGAKFIF